MPGPIKSHRTGHLNKSGGPGSRTTPFLFCKRIAVVVLGAVAFLPLICHAQVDESFPGDLEVSDVRVGSGTTAFNGDIVDIHFTGWIEVASAKGTEFIDSRDYQNSLSFQLGTTRIPASWSDVVRGMRVGGVRSVSAPAGLMRAADANGERLPSDTRVIYEFELLDARS